MPVKKMTANPLAPLRYRPGKPVGGAEDESESESESNSESESEAERAKAQAEAQGGKAPPPRATSFPKISAGLNKQELERRRQEAIAARAREAELASKAEDGFETASESGSSAGGEAEQDSEEEDSSSSDDDDDQTRRAKPRLIAPTFVKKSQRTIAGKEEQAAEDERRRLEKADELLQAQIAKEAAERAAAKKAWDDDDDEVQDEGQVDDTDNLDPDAERAAWRLRELKRIKRAREAIQQAEAEREEVERRRNLSAAERDDEDARFIDAQKAERDAAKGQMGFMQKYFHKGAFFQGGGDDGDDAAAPKRDLMGARYADDAANRELLPQYMQIRDMTKLGKKGRTKYRDMKSEDTGRWGDFGSSNDNSRKPQDGPSGANASAVGQRTTRPRDDDRQGRGGGDGGRDEKRRRFDR